MLTRPFIIKFERHMGGASQVPPSLPPCQAVQLLMLRLPPDTSTWLSTYKAPPTNYILTNRAISWVTLFVEVLRRSLASAFTPPFQPASELLIVKTPSNCFKLF